MGNPSKIHRPTAHVVAHRGVAVPWRRQQLLDLASDARQASAAWLKQPVAVPRRAHALVAAIYTFVAVDSGLVVVLLGAHR